MIGSSSQNTESYPLLRDAYAIIDGIPDNRIDLAQWRKVGRSPHSCGTIACAAGWLSMHPDMKDRGLLSGSGGMPKFRNESGYFSYCYEALAIMFGIDRRSASDIFCTRFMGGRLDPENAGQLSDKELWKARVRNFLKKNI